MMMKRISLVEPDALTSQPPNVDSVTNQDGWLNALSLDKLTNTVDEHLLFVDYHVALLFARG